MNAGLCIRNVHLVGVEGLHDVVLSEGRVRRVAAIGMEEVEGEVLDGAGGLLSSAFVDAHTHLEKALIEPKGEFPTLDDAVRAFNQYSRTTLSRADIVGRASHLCRMAVKNGTLALRTHIRLAEDCGTEAVEAVLEVRERFADILDVQVVGMVTCYKQVLSPNVLTLMDRAAGLGVEVFGTAAHLSDRPEYVVDQVVDKAGEHNLLIDFHVDETDEPDIRSLRHLCARIEAEPGLYGRVTAGHLCALSAVDDGLAAETIGRMAAVGLHVAVMPSCNLYLMGRHDKEPRRRGVTRVREMLAAGVNVACASDNVRDHFRPFGNADLLEEGLLLAQVCQLGTPASLRQVYDTLTVNPARMLGLDKERLAPGARADLVLLPVSGPEQALISQPNDRTVIRAGRIIYTRRSEETTLHNLLEI